VARDEVRCTSSCGETWYSIKRFGPERIDGLVRRAKVVTRATGGAIPAFEVEATFPSPVEMVSPDFSRGFVLDPSKSMDFHWVPTDESVLLAVSQFPLSDPSPLNSFEFLCTLPGGSAEGSLTKDILGGLTPSNEDNSLATNIIVAHAVTRTVRWPGITLNVSFARAVWRNAQL